MPFSVFIPCKYLSADFVISNAKFFHFSRKATTIKLIEAGRRNFKIKTLYTIANSLNVSSDYLIGRIDTPVPESTVVGNLISELTTEEVIYLVSILSRYVEILKKAGTDRNENSSV